MSIVTPVTIFMCNAGVACVDAHGNKLWTEWDAGMEVAERVAACVNACAGIPTEVLTEAATITLPAHELRKQRDSLAAALREISDDYRFTHESDQSHPYWGDRAKAYAETARAALAKLDGKS